MTRWQMIKAVWGSLGEWREACEQAKRNGWTRAEVEWIITLFHPLTFVIGWVLVMCLISFIVELIRGV